MSPNIRRSPSPLEAMLDMGFGEVLLDDDIALDMGFGENPLDDEIALDMGFSEDPLDDDIALDIGFGAPHVSDSVAVGEVAVDADVPMQFGSCPCRCGTVASPIPSLTTITTVNLGTCYTPVTSSDAQLNVSAEEPASSPQPDLPSVFDLLVMYFSSDIIVMCIVALQMAQCMISEW